nr:PREDICTED: dnaJ homolog subfamily C member 2 [Bemisia tabaci]
MAQLESKFKFACENHTVECIGPFFFQHVSALNADAESKLKRLKKSIRGGSSEDIDCLEFEDDVSYLKSLDPLKWKEQDHYHVLGLKKLRYKASENDIKLAYRKMVLKHHPDKRVAAGETVNRDEDYFLCITKAYETLGDKKARKAYDSVDPTIDDKIPSDNANSRENFFKVFKPVFDRNAHWSEILPVPSLGGPTDSRSKVEKFYNFWFNFQSWREFSYYDEEEKDKGHDREERRWIDKQNKAMRAKYKKEEMSRIRNLVELAYKLDPRIAKFRIEEKEKKQAAKLAKQEAVRARIEGANRAAREAEEKMRKKKEEVEAAEREKLAAEKAEKEEMKKALKKQRQTVRKICKTNNYFIQTDKELVPHMSNIEKMCDMYSLDELKSLCNGLANRGREYLLEKIQEIDETLEAERHSHLTPKLNVVSKENYADPAITNGVTCKPPWSHGQVQLLIKAVNLFPAGTNHRWEVVANFLNQHSAGGTTRTAKEVLTKVKDMQHTDFSQSDLKVVNNEEAYSNFEKEKKRDAVVEAPASERFPEQPALPWSAEEQQLLEQALKTYPNSVSDRWDKIAATVSTRSKKECMKRYKELVELVKAKKKALETAQKKK